MRQNQFINRVDLTELTRTLRVCFRNGTPKRYGRGRQSFSQVIMQLLNCDPSQARAVVHALEASGHLVWSRDEWTVTAPNGTPSKVEAA